jgi:hypothetical protein
MRQQEANQLSGWHQMQIVLLINVIFLNLPRAKAN